MKKTELEKILKLHSEWQQDIRNGQRADLRGADLRRADLRGADLRRADLHGANLSGADLRGANLFGANLRGANLFEADLSGANLCGADLDFSVWPLHCGSFNAKADDRLLYQLIAHITRLNTENMSDEAKKAIGALSKWRNKFCNFRADVKKI